MAQHRRDKTDRITPGAPPRLTVKRGPDGALRLSPEVEPEGVHPETIAEERPAQPDDPRSAHIRNVGGPYGGS